MDDEFFIIDEIFEHSGFRLELIFRDDITPGSTGYWGVRELFVEVLTYTVGCTIGSLYADDECSICEDGFLLFEEKCRLDCPIYTELAPGTCNDTGTSDYFFPYAMY